MSKKVFLYQEVLMLLDFMSLQTWMLLLDKQTNHIAMVGRVIAAELQSRSKLTQS